VCLYNGDVGAGVGCTGPNLYFSASTQIAGNKVQRLHHSGAGA